jgi:hypothetical protein
MRENSCQQARANMSSGEKAQQVDEGKRADPEREDKECPRMPRTMETCPLNIQ